MKDALDGKVKEVKVSTRLKDHPVCLSADGPLSIEMEKVLSKQPGSEGVKSDKVLELNVNHPVFAVLKAAQEAGDTDKLKKYSALLLSLIHICLHPPGPPQGRSPSGPGCPRCGRG